MQRILPLQEAAPYALELVRQPHSWRVLPPLCCHHISATAIACMLEVVLVETVQQARDLICTAHPASNQQRLPLFKTLFWRQKQLPSFTWDQLGSIPHAGHNLKLLYKYRDSWNHNVRGESPQTIIGSWSHATNKPATMKRIGQSEVLSVTLRLLIECKGSSGMPVCRDKSLGLHYLMVEYISLIAKNARKIQG